MAGPSRQGSAVGGTVEERSTTEQVCLAQRQVEGPWLGTPHSSNHVLPAVVSDPCRAEGKDKAGLGCVWLGGAWGEKLPPGGLFQEGLTARAEGPGSGVWVGREGHQSLVMSTYSWVGGLGGQLTC